MDNLKLGEFGVENIAAINDILLEATRQKAMAESELDYCNRKQEDILHILEFGGHGRKELANLAKELESIRKRRRIAKNTLEIVAPILRWQSENNAAYLKISRAIGETRKIDNMINTTVYHLKADGGEVIKHVG